MMTEGLFTVYVLDGDFTDDNPYAPCVMFSKLSFEQATDLARLSLANGLQVVLANEEDHGKK